MNKLIRQVDSLLFNQKQDWALARANYAALAHVQSRYFQDSSTTIVQFNPERIRSSAAKIDKASLQARPCFFCHRPEEQEGVKYNDSFEILVNPYPIFEDHLTIPLLRHEKQQILLFFEDMLCLASDLPDFFIFYNGPRCGASAPDHMHFQAGRKGELPIMENWKQAQKGIVWQGSHSVLYALKDFQPSTFVLASSDPYEAVEAFDLLYAQLQIKADDYEPMMNIVAWMEEEVWHICLFPRRELRPSCFYAEGEANMLISPATVEMSGLFVVPLEKDFKKVTHADLENIWKEVSITEEEKNEIIRKIRETV